MYREALTMGLNQHDQVIRRRLAQKLEFLAKDLVALTPPTEEELQAYFAEQAGPLPGAAALHVHPGLL